jgi:hypothetical protein
VYWDGVKYYTIPQPLLIVYFPLQTSPVIKAPRPPMSNTVIHRRP